jgi:GNAT superfamily N-acetyltransferase
MACTVLRTLRIEPGVAADYRFFEPFHYRAGPPRGVTRVLLAFCGDGALPVGIAVETVPPLNCAARERALPGRYAGLSRRDRAVALNRDVRTIARVVVHPIYRGTGIGVRLVCAILNSAETPFVEAFAAMGRVHPLFERAGMRRVEVPRAPESVRLEAALAVAGVRPIDLVDLPLRRVRGAFREALRHAARDKAAAPGAWLAEARRRLLSSPVYYLWQRPPGAAESV